jgi:hypothetical protein
MFLIGRFLKLLGQIDRNFVGRSSIKMALFVPIRLQIWPPQAILVSEKFTNQKQELPVTAIFVNESGQNEQSS